MFKPLYTNRSKDSWLCPCCNRWHELGSLKKLKAQQVEGKGFAAWKLQNTLLLLLLRQPCWLGRCWRGLEVVHPRDQQWLQLSPQGRRWVQKRWPSQLRITCEKLLMEIRLLLLPVSTAGRSGSGDPLFGDVTQRWGFPSSSQSRGAPRAMPGSEAGPQGGWKPHGAMACLAVVSTGRAQGGFGWVGWVWDSLLGPCYASAGARLRGVESKTQVASKCYMGDATREIPAREKGQREALTIQTGKSEPLKQTG